MPDATPGLHHVTAITGAPQATVDAYAGVLGLRLVKTTVNVDDPSTYHLYFGDRTGTPGTLFTCFPFRSCPRGRVGTGQAAATSFAVPPEALDAWAGRLEERGFEVDAPVERFDEPVLACRDGDGRPGRGTVHHVAFRCADEAAQDAWRERLVGAGLAVTPPRDRQYFRSVYFREPGGVLFELATDGPGFAVDEPVEALGSSLRLPPWLEADRDDLEARLPALDVPAARAG